MILMPKKQLKILKEWAEKQIILALEEVFKNQEKAGGITVALLYHHMENFKFEEWKKIDKSDKTMIIALTLTSMVRRKKLISIRNRKNDARYYKIRREQPKLEEKEEEKQDPEETMAGGGGDDIDTSEDWKNA